MRLYAQHVTLLGQNVLADITDVGFHDESLLSINKRAISTPYNNQNNVNTDKPFDKKPGKP